MYKFKIGDRVIASNVGFNCVTLTGTVVEAQSAQSACRSILIFFDKSFSGGHADAYQYSQKYLGLRSWWTLEVDITPVKQPLTLWDICD